MGIWKRSIFNHLSGENFACFILMVQPITSNVPRFQARCSPYSYLCAHPHVNQLLSPPSPHSFSPPRHSKQSSPHFRHIRAIFYGVKTDTIFYRSRLVPGLFQNQKEWFYCLITNDDDNHHDADHDGDVKYDDDYLTCLAEEKPSQPLPTSHPHTLSQRREYFPAKKYFPFKSPLLFPNVLPPALHPP